MMLNLKQLSNMHYLRTKEDDYMFMLHKQSNNLYRSKKFDPTGVSYLQDLLLAKESNVFEDF